MRLTVQLLGRTPGGLQVTDAPKPALLRRRVEPAPASGGLQLETAPTPGAAEQQEKAIHVTGDSMLFRRETHTVQILGAVHALQTTHGLTAESLLLELDESFHARRLVASGHPQMRDSGVQGPMALDADEISAALTPEGLVESVVANGNVHGSRNSSAGEDAMGAGRVQVKLATRQNVPRLLTAGGGVTITSRSATPAGGTRRVESEALEMHFSESSRPGQALLESVNTLAPARIEWQNVAAPSGSAANGKPVKQTMHMRGQRMNLQFDGQNQLQQLASSGGVEVTRHLGDGPEQATASRELTAKFRIQASGPQWTRPATCASTKAPHRAGRPRPPGPWHEYGHAHRIGNPFRPGHAHDGTNGNFHTRFE